MDDESVAIELTLTRKQWCELYNAMGSKKAAVAQGLYGGGKSTNSAWVADLQSVEDAVLEACAEKGVNV